MIKLIYYLFKKKENWINLHDKFIVLEFDGIFELYIYDPKYKDRELRCSNSNPNLSAFELYKLIKESCSKMDKTIKDDR